MKFGQQVEYGP